MHLSRALLHFLLTPHLYRIRDTHTIGMRMRNEGTMRLPSEQMKSMVPAPWKRR